MSRTGGSVAAGTMIEPISGRTSGAFFTVEQGTELGGATLACHHPRAVDPGRVMPHVLEMTAVQLGNPVILIVPMKAGDRAVHAVQVSKV